jgi:hypothetical protein
MFSEDIGMNIMDIHIAVFAEKVSEAGAVENRT